MSGHVLGAPGSRVETGIGAEEEGAGEADAGEGRMSGVQFLSGGFQESEAGGDVNAHIEGLGLAAGGGEAAEGLDGEQESE